MTKAELRELVHLLLMCGITDKTALESGNVTNEEWLRMHTLIDKHKKRKRRTKNNNNQEADNQARNHFNGICPYTDKPCDDWECQTCEVEQREREWMEGEEE